MGGGAGQARDMYGNAVTSGLAGGTRFVVRVVVRTTAAGQQGTTGRPPMYWSTAGPVAGTLHAAFNAATNDGRHAGYHQARSGPRAPESRRAARRVPAPVAARLRDKHARARAHTHTHTHAHAYTHARARARTQTQTHTLLHTHPYHHPTPTGTPPFRAPFEATSIRVAAREGPYRRGPGMSRTTECARPLRYPRLPG